MLKFWKSVVVSLFLSIPNIGCQFNSKSGASHDGLNTVFVVGALKNVMQNGELQGRIRLDTIANREGLYGLGPEAFLTGELLIYDGESFVSRVQPDSSIVVLSTVDVSAPFFVYAHVDEWEMQDLPADVHSIHDLEQYLMTSTSGFDQPYAFKLIGTAGRAVFHVQNLAEGTEVSSPEEAHQGQINYELIDEEVEILGFFSKEHKGIFTHHDSNVHMHLITKDEQQMGHLDELEIGNMKLFLPQE
jgi:acetolactate decarboxylase